MAHYNEQLHPDFDPFGSGTETEQFFPGGQRQELLDQLLELCRYSSDLIIVAGPLSSGKSTLAQWLARGLDDEFVIVQVQASLFMSAGQFLETLCRELELDIASDASVTQLIDRLDQYADSLRASSRTLQLLVDDAHDLGEEALSCILQLLKRQADAARLGEDGIKAVLLGEAILLGSVQKLAPSAHKLLELEALNLEETVKYIEFKLGCAGFDGRLPIDQDALAVIHSRSRGLPGTINVLTRDELGDTLVPTQSLPRPGFAERNLVPLSVLSGVLALALFFVLGGENRPEPVETASVSMSQPSQQEGLAGQVRAENPLQIIRASAVIGNAETADIGLPDSPASESEPATGSGNHASAALPTSLSQSGGDTDKGSVPPSWNHGVAAEGGDISSALSDLEPEDGDILPVLSDLEPEGGDILPALSDLEPEVGLPAETQAPGSLLAQSADSYTLQLLGSYSESNVNKFISSHREAVEMDYFESRYQDKPWFVVVYGNFSSLGEAREAIDQLPATIQELKPWARKLADIQANIRRYQ